MRQVLKLLNAGLVLLLWPGPQSCPGAEAAGPSGQARWWKGNLHTHSFWSDGDDYPEMIVAWYKEHGYEFLALSDHNRMQVGEKWIPVLTNGVSVAAFEKYLRRFGTQWVPRCLLLIAGEKISDSYTPLPIHLNATNLRELIPPQHGTNAFDVIQNNVNAVLDQRRKTGQPMIPHINHPNFVWALTAEDIMRVQGERFLEIYNGHPITWNYGDTNHAGAERIWDIVLTRRLAELRMEPIWGTAVDDAHNYHEYRIGHSNPGRGWLMVRAAELTPAALIAALEKGDFYSTSGVRLSEVRRTPNQLCLEIEAENGVTYTTQFIGTRKGYDATSEPVMAEGQPVRVPINCVV